MITSSAPIRRWPRPRWSRRTPVVGRLRPPSKKCVLTWDWRRREDGKRRPCCGWRPACLGCSRWSRCCTTCCRCARGRGPGGMAGQGRDDLLRCHHGGKALAVGELGFCKPWVRRGLFKTLTPVPGGLAFSLVPACVTVEKGQKTSLVHDCQSSTPNMEFIDRPSCLSRDITGPAPISPSRSRFCD